MGFTVIHFAAPRRVLVGNDVLLYVQRFDTKAQPEPPLNNHSCSARPQRPRV